MIVPEIYMAKPQFERGSQPQRLPETPSPSSTSAPEGMEHARALARRYLPDLVRLHAGIALATDSEAALPGCSPLRRSANLPAAYRRPHRRRRRRRMRMVAAVRRHDR